MERSKARSRFEAQLAIAHRAMHRAEEAADDLGDPGAAYDCYAIGSELRRLMEDSIAGHRHRSWRAQTLPDV